MRSIWSTGALLITLSVGAGWVAAQEPPKGDEAKLQGTWMGQVIGGMPGKPDNRFVMTVQGAQCEFTSGVPGAEFKGTLVLNAAANPRQVDFVVKECPDAKYVGKSALAIYKFNDDGSFTLAANEPGNAGRPEKFEGNEQTPVFVFKKWEPGMLLPGNPPELKVLQRRIGTWTVQTTVKPGPWNPAERKITGTETTEWVLGGRFMQTRTTNRPANPDGISLVTYDPQRKAYRGWWADDQGNTSEMTGQWDETAQTLSLTSDAKDGFRAASTLRFVGPDSAEWQLTVTASDGKVMLEMDGRLARKK